MNNDDQQFELKNVLNSFYNAKIQCLPIAKNENNSNSENHIVATHNEKYKALKSWQSQKNSKLQVSSLTSLIIMFIIIVFVIFMFIDIRNEYQKQIQYKNMQKYQCSIDYHENKCHNPVEAIAIHCSQLEKCTKMIPQKQIRLTTIMTQIFGCIIDILMKSYQRYLLIGFVIAFLILWQKIKTETNR